MMKLSNRTVSAKLASSLVQNLLDVGFSWDTITKETGIYPEEILIPTRRINAEQHYKLLTLLQSDNGRLDWFVKPNNFKAELFLNRNNILASLTNDALNLTLLCLNARNLRDAIVLYVKYRSIIGNVDNFSVQNTEHGMTLGFFHEYPELIYQFVPMINFIYIIAIIEHYARGIPSPTLKYQVNVKCQKNHTLETIYNYWNCDVKWEAPLYSLTFDYDDLDSPYAEHNPAVYDILLDKVDKEYQAIVNVTSIRGLVEDAIYELIHNQDVIFKSSLAIKKVCDRLGISQTTLSRRLKDENTTYKEIEKKIKLEESINLLKNTNTPVGIISSNLGFSNQAGFNRFFNDQMNISPLKFRKA